MTTAPTPFDVFQEGTYLHGTKAQLVPGELLTPGYASNFEEGRTLRHIYITQTLDAAAWGAELATGDGPGRIYVVEPTGPIEDDPNVTDKRFPGNPTRSYRTMKAVLVLSELENWTGHTPEQIQAMRDGLADLRDRGENTIID